MEKRRIRGRSEKRGEKTIKKAGIREMRKITPGV
jgi:hypothetical protein